MFTPVFGFLSISCTFVNPSRLTEAADLPRRALEAESLGLEMVLWTPEKQHERPYNPAPRISSPFGAVGRGSTYI